jgi:hypothetical protein
VTDADALDDLIAEIETLCVDRRLRVARNVRLGPYLAPVAIAAHDREGADRDVMIAIEPRGWSRAVAARMGSWAETERQRLRNLNQADFVAIVVADEGEGPGGITTLGELRSFLDGFAPPVGSSNAGGNLRSAPVATHAYESEMAARVASYTGGGIVFVAMPFAETFAPVFFDLVAPAVAAANLVAMRTDQEPTLVSIDKRIREGIRLADIVVADLTTHNPNVFYELGIAHAIGKRSLLLRQSGVDLPFDVRYHEAFDYTATALSGRVDALRQRLADAAADLWAGPRDGGKHRDERRA